VPELGTGLGAGVGRWGSDRQGWLRRKDPVAVQEVDGDREMLQYPAGRTYSMVGVDLYWSRLPPRPRSSAALIPNYFLGSSEPDACATSVKLKMAAALSFFCPACPCAGVVLNDLVLRLRLLLGAIAGLMCPIKKVVLMLH
jgi:hypothetical protein